MNLSRPVIWVIAAAFLTFGWFAGSPAWAEEVFRIAYGGYNETAGTMWVGIIDTNLRDENYLLVGALPGWDFVVKTILFTRENCDELRKNGAGEEGRTPDLMLGKKRKAKRGR